MSNKILRQIIEEVLSKNRDNKRRLKRGLILSYLHLLGERETFRLNVGRDEGVPPSDDECEIVIKALKEALVNINRPFYDMHIVTGQKKGHILFSTISWNEPVQTEMRF